MGLLRLQLMCIHLSFVIRLPLATEADPFDVETQGMNSAVTYGIIASLSSITCSQGINKTSFNLIQIRYRYKGTRVEKSTFPHFDFHVIV